MAIIPESVVQAWDEREGPQVLTTVSEDGIPNSIYVKSVSRFGNDRIAVANNYFNKTMKNIRAGNTGSILFITREGKPYQLKGSLEYFTDGPLFNDMKKWNPDRHPGHGVVVLTVEEVFSGAEQIVE